MIHNRAMASTMLAVAFTIAAHASPDAVDQLKDTPGLSQILSTDACLQDMNALGVGKNLIDTEAVKSGLQQVSCGYKDNQLVVNASTNSLSSVLVIYGWEDWTTPYIVALYNEDPKKKTAHAYCTGVVVSRTQVLTATHCYPYVGDYVRVDKVNPDTNPSGPDGLRVMRIDYVGKDTKEFPPNGVSGSYGADLAVVYVDKPFPPYVGIGQIITDLNLNTKSTLNVTGYGKSEVLGEQDVKRTAAINLYDKDCLAANGQPNIAAQYQCGSKREFVAGNKTTGADACFGDSGGPVLMRMEGKNNWGILGLVSRGMVTAQGVDCGKAGTIYTLLSPYAAYLARQGIQTLKSEPAKTSTKILKSGVYPDK